MGLIYRILFICCIIICCNYLQAQTKIIDEGIICASQYINPYPTNQLQYEGDWLTGTIEFTNGKSISGVMLRYNSWLDELAWLRTSDYSVGLVIKESVKAFYFDAGPGMPKRYFTKLTASGITDSPDTGIYLELLADGPVKLYCRYKTNVTQHTGAMKFKRYYYLQYQNKLIRFNAGKRRLLSNLSPDDRLIMKDIIRQNKLKVRKQADLANAIKFFNEKINK